MNTTSVLLIKPGTNKGEFYRIEVVPRIGEQIFLDNRTYDVAMVKHFINAEEIKEYKNRVPFTRIILMNQ